jgi:WD40 repeat protein
VSALARAMEAVPAGDSRRLDLLRSGPERLMEAQRWDELEAVLTDLGFLEAKVQAGLAADLVNDLTQALQHLPADRPVWRILQLLEEALRRDLHFIERHPAALFQCLGNRGWWYDGPQTAQHYDPPEGGWPAEGPPWAHPLRLAPLLESWRRHKEERTPGFAWLRSLRPPPFPLGSPQRVVIRVDTDRHRFLNLAFAPDGTRLFAWLNPVGVAGREGRSLRVWDSELGREVEDYAKRDVPPHDPRISPTHRWRAELGGPGGGWGQPVRLFDVVRGSEVASLPTDEDVNLQEAAFSPGGERLIAGGWGEESGGEVMVWNVATGRRLAWLRPDGAVFAVAVSQDGQRAATGTSKGPIHLWDVEAGTMMATLEGHESSVQALAFTADGRRLASAAHDGTVRIWDLERMAPLARLRRHPDSITDITFSTDGRRLVTTSTNATTWIWDAQDGSPVACPYRTTSVVLMGGPPCNGVYADYKQITLLACGRTCDAATGKVLHSEAEEDWRFYSSDITWAPGGQHFAVFGRHGGTCIYKTARPEKPQMLEGHTGDVSCARFSPDGQRLVTGSDDHTCRIWSAHSGPPLLILRGHEGAITCVAWSPDSMRIVSGATDRTVRVWDAASGTELHCLRVEDCGIWSTSWSSDGTHSETHAFSAVAFSADGRHILTLSGRDCIRLWDVAAGSCLQTIAGEGDIQAVAAGLPWQAFLRGDVLEVESAQTRDVVARVPYSRVLGARKPPVARPDGQAWAGTVNGHLFFWELCR